MKYDNGKAPLALLPPEALIKIAEVLAFGAEKYGANVHILLYSAI
jgi:hypothetical protein